VSQTPVLCELVNGVLSRPARANMVETRNPATGALIALAPASDHDGVTAAIGAARLAFDDGRWSALPVAARAALLRDVADQIEANQEALARAETTDTGMLLTMTTQGHVPRAAAHFRYFANEAERMGGECFPMDGAYLQLVQREALGVVAILAPWSAPLAVATIHLAAALAAGNTVVLKSSERAPLSLSLLAELIAGVDFPPGVVNILHGHGETTGKAVVQSEAVDGLCFVGGSDTAQAIMAQRTNFFRRNFFELGGKSPTIVCQDARIDDAIDGALLSVFSSNGEVCTAGSRVLVHAALYPQFAARFIERTRAIRVGDPCDPATELGPLIDAAHLARVAQHLRTAQREGAQLACGGVRPGKPDAGCYLSPAVVTGVTPAMSLFHEEVFGPVAALIPFKDENEAVALANNSRYGLSATVWCGDASAGLALARRLRCGVVGVNSPVIRDIRVPFGGIRASGLGRTGGRWSLEQYTEVKTSCVAVDGYALPRYGAHEKPDDARR
jgi:acyl-CoA reductase-like NAD-dependent aldehyde dehydrogenase